MKPLNNLIGNLYERLDIARCAGAMRVDVKTAYPYQQPPDKNGVTIPVKNLIRLLEYSRDSADRLCQQTNMEIAMIFCLAAGVKAIGLEVLAHLQIGVEALSNGGHLKASGAICPSCAAPLKHKGWIDNVPVYSCGNCRGIERSGKGAKCEQ